MNTSDIELNTFDHGAHVKYVASTDTVDAVLQAQHTPHATPLTAGGLILSEPLPQFSVLTRREQDVMLCIARGMPNKTIGATLGISQRTVEAHRARIFRKLDLRNAVELANYVWQKCHPAVASALISG